MSYRSDENAVESRRVELERELGNVKSQIADVQSFAARKREIERELGGIKRRKDGEEQVRLPMLARARIASPCSADWYQMAGDDRVRFCSGCKKNVYNLSAMTAVEAETLMQEKGVDLCARLYRRKDGTVMTSDCPVGVRVKWMNRVSMLFFAIIGGALAFIGIARFFGPPIKSAGTGGAVSYLAPG